MRFFTLYILIFILLFFSCRIENKPGTNIVAETYQIDSTNYDKTIITEDVLIEFNSYADTLIMKALNKNNLNYKIKIDSQFQSPYLTFFESDGLLKNIKYEFKLKQPYAKYSFRLTEYKYSAVSEAKDILERLTTILLVSPIGLN